MLVKLNEVKVSLESIEYFLRTLKRDLMLLRVDKYYTFNATNDCTFDLFAR